MTITVKQAKDALKAAYNAHIMADIEHPTAVIIAKAFLAETRMDYSIACHELIERLMLEDDPISMYNTFNRETA